MPATAAGTGDHHRAALASAPGTAETERLLHRRHGWAWTTVLSLIGLVGYAVIGAHFFPGATGALADVSAAIVAGLLALAAAGLVVVLVDTVRLHRLDATMRAAARGRVSHYPVVAHAYRYPPKHRISALFGKLLLAGWIVLTISFLPSQVNAVAFLAGAGGTGTFFPVSYAQECGRGGCTTVTNGNLVTGATTASATWPGQAPLDLPFTVRTPAWNGWGSVQLVGNDENAVVSIIVGLLFDTVAVVAVFAFAVMVRHWLTRLHQPAASVAA